MFGFVRFTNTELLILKHAIKQYVDEITVVRYDKHDEWMDAIALKEKIEQELASRKY